MPITKDTAEILINAARESISRYFTDFPELRAEWADAVRLVINNGDKEILAEQILSMIFPEATN